MGGRILDHPGTRFALAAAFWWTGTRDPTRVRLGFLCTALSFGFLLIGSVVWHYARGAMTLRSHELQMEDRRRPILFLRSFDDDQLRLRSSPLLMRSPLDLVLGPRAELFEEIVRRGAAPFGPVIAISRPGRGTQPPGISRERLHPIEDWRNEIKGWFASAGTIICSLGSTPGLRDELQIIQHMDDPPPVLIVIPPIGEDELTERLQDLRSLNGVHEVLGKAVTHQIAGLGSALDGFTIPGTDHALVVVLERGNTVVYTGQTRDHWHYHYAIRRAMSYLTRPTWGTPAYASADFRFFAHRIRGTRVDLAVRKLPDLPCVAEPKGRRASRRV